jgi:transcriptional regulator with XRE-family HTH domain
LSKQGVGRRALAAASDVQATTISKIKSGERTTIRKRTEDRILGIDDFAVSDAALVAATPTWRQIRALVAEGFSKAELARRLGYSNSSLRFGKQLILARNAARVDRLYRMVMKE